MDITTAVMLAEPLRQLVRSLKSTSAEDREKIAKHLDDISRCAAEITQQLKIDINANALQLCGEMEFFADNLQLALADVTSGESVAPIATRIASLVDRFKASYEKEISLGAIERASIIREFDVVAGRFRAQARAIRELPTRSTGRWAGRSAVGSAMAATGAGIVWLSDISIDAVAENSKKAWSLATRAFKKSESDSDRDATNNDIA